MAYTIITGSNFEETITNVNTYLTSITGSLPVGGLQQNTGFFLQAMYSGSIG